MDGLTGVGAALAAMREDEGRYEGCLMLSALPGAPVVEPARRRFVAGSAVLSAIRRRGNHRPGAISVHVIGSAPPLNQAPRVTVYVCSGEIGRAHV